MVNDQKYTSFRTGEVWPGINYLLCIVFSHTLRPYINFAIFENIKSPYFVSLVKTLLRFCQLKGSWRNQLKHLKPVYFNSFTSEATSWGGISNQLDSRLYLMSFQECFQQHNYNHIISFVANNKTKANVCISCFILIAV